MFFFFKRSIFFINCIFILLVWFDLSKALYELRVKPSKSELVSALGSSVVLTCEICHVKGDDEGWMEGSAMIYWVKTIGNREIKSEKGRVFTENDGTKIKKLFITKIKEEDAGEYRCLMKSGHRSEAKTINLIVFKDITFDHAPNPQHPRIFTTALIECQVSSQPPPIVSWKFNGENIQYGAKYKQVARGLQIANISKNDNGNYTCGAEVGSEGKYEERSITVVVHVPPVMIHGPSKETGIEGRDLSIYCKAESDPMPSYEFYKNKNEKLFHSSPSERLLVDSHLGKITFKPLKREDSGIYRCRALNDAGEASTNITLQVYVPPIIYEFRNVTVIEGEIAKMTCKTQGEPQPHITLQPLDKEPFRLGSNDNDRILVQSKTSSILEMLIDQPMPHHNAPYLCRVVNLAGEANLTAHLKVLYKPKFSSDQERKMYTWPGRVHNLTCTAHGNPQPSFRWIKNSLILSNNDTFTIYSSEKSSNLQIRVKEADQNWIYGELMCRASNQQGSRDQKLQLIKASLPDPPMEVLVKENSPNLVMLQVKPPLFSGGVHLIGYRVEYDQNTIDYNFFQLHDTHHQQEMDYSFLVVENLKSNTEYVLRVGAKNEVGVGQFSDVLVTTEPKSKPYPMRLTSSKTAGDPWSYRIIWDKPKTGGKPIKEYEIKYKKVKIKSYGTVESLEPWRIVNVKENKYQPSLGHILTNLQPKTEYQVQVIAKNELGPSAHHEKFIFKTPAESIRSSYLKNEQSQAQLKIFIFLISIFFAIKS